MNLFDEIKETLHSGFVQALGAGLIIAILIAVSIGYMGWWG